MKTGFLMAYFLGVSTPIFLALVLAVVWITVVKPRLR